MREPDERKADILDAVRNRDGLVIATGTVAEAADMSRPTARKYLEQLEDEGEVVEEELAGRMYVWYTPEVLEYGLARLTDEDPTDPSADEREEESELRADSGPPPEQEGSPELMSTVEDLEESVTQLRRDVAEQDTAGEKKYADVDSSARRYWLKERDTWQRFITPLGTATTGMLILAVLAAGLRLPAIPGLGVEPFVVAMGLALALAGGVGLAAITAAVITLLLRTRVFKKAGRTLPFRASPDGEPRET